MGFATSASPSPCTALAMPAIFVMMPYVTIAPATKIAASPNFTSQSELSFRKPTRSRRWPTHDRRYPWNCSPTASFSSFTSRARAADCSSALPVAAACRALDLRRLAHDRVVAELPNLVFVERPAGELLLPIHLFIEIDEDPHGPEPARRARLDGHAAVSPAPRRA